MADVRTGKLRERVDIYESVDTPNTPFGGTKSENVLYWQTYANITPLLSSKTIIGNQEQMDDGFQVIVRYRKDKSVNKRLKMLYRGKWLNLTSIVKDDILKQFVTFVGSYKEVL